MNIKNTTISFVTALVLAIAPAAPAGALDWQDSEWAGLGCPSQLSGSWVPSTHSPYTGIHIEFKPNGAALTGNKFGDMFFSYSPNSGDASFLNLERVSDEPVSFPRFLKIRPHIAVQSISKGKKYALCKIKVFLFESQQKADQMAYVSWDIYSTIDSIEVPHGN